MWRWVVEKCGEEVLWRSVAEKCCEGVLWRSVVEKCCREVLWRSLCDVTHGELCKSFVLNFIRKELLETNHHLLYGFRASAERSLPFVGSAGSPRWILDFAPCRRTCP